MSVLPSPSAPSRSPCPSPTPVCIEARDIVDQALVRERALTTCQEHEPTGRCGVIDTLSASARGKRP